MRFEHIKKAINEVLEGRKKQISGLSSAEALAESARISALLANDGWRPNKDWLEGLPTLLCGPIVRTVLIDQVTVWVALKEKAEVVLQVTERRPNGDQGFSMFAGKRNTVQIGEHLHVVAVTAKASTAVERLLPGGTYYYNLVWNGETLASHRDDLVYGKDPDRDPLPSFVVPPHDLNELRILHGSCRNVVGSGYDATPNLDTLLEKSWDQTTKSWTWNRPHQLFLTGDQIYADEGNDILLNLVGEVGYALMAGLNDSGPVWEEELPMPNDVLRIDPENNEAIDMTGGLRKPSKLYPGLRTVRAHQLCLGVKQNDKHEPFDLLSEGLKFTAKSGNHLFGLGEFFAYYLLVWSDKVWTGIFRDLGFAEEMSKLQEIFQDSEKKASSVKKDEKAIRTAEAVFGENHFKNLTEEQFKNYVEWFHFSVSKTEPDRAEILKKIAEQFLAQVQAFFKFTLTAQGVAKVRRGLANIPTYMMFDDHEVTDDWHMTRDWTDEVYKSPMAVRVMQNALSAYAIFQGWGNTPERFEGDQPGKKFLDAIETWIGSGMPGGDQANAVLERVIPCKPKADGSAERFLNEDALIGSEKAIQWDYRLTFGKYEAVTTDARTRRAFTKRKLGPAEHLSKEAIKAQLPDVQGGEFLPEFTLLVSPCNIVTIPDFRKGFVRTLLPLEVGISLLKHLWKGGAPKAAIFNYDPDLADSWFVAEGPFERLLARVAARMPIANNERIPARVILLSGDVHFSATSRLQYWADKPFNDSDGVAGIVMAHLVSSGFKNETPVWMILQHLGFEALDVVDDEKRLPKTEVMAGYNKKVNDLTTEERDKRKELISKTRWSPNYHASMFVPADPNAPSLLPYHQTDPTVKIPKPDWFYRIDHMRGTKPKPVDPNDPKLHKFTNPFGGGLQETINKVSRNMIEHFKYGKNFAAGLEVMAFNSIAEVTLAWEGSGTLAEPLNADSQTFKIKAEVPFSRAPFQVVIETEIIQVLKAEAAGVDVHIIECKRGAVKTPKAAHAANTKARVRRLVSQTHWIAKAKQEGKLPIGIADIECAEFTRYDIAMELDDLEYPKPVFNV